MAPRPLVSVLIRTTGRDTLGRAVEAAASQGHRPLEIVVVNSSARPLPPLPQVREAVVRVVEGGPYNRPGAANAALAHARGAWLVFLDDDDTCAPNHVQSLLAAAERSGGARVAYSATVVVEPDGSARIMIGAEFNRMHLFTGNYLCITSALFHRSLVEQGARFDERLDCFEDWDFIIQLAQRTRFTYTGQPTNYWNAHAGESGAGLGANKRDDATRPFREMVISKWAARAAELGAELARHPEQAMRITRGDLAQDMVREN